MAKTVFTPEMEALSRHIYELVFENRFLLLKGTEFQRFFTELMKLRHKGDFKPVKPWGKDGDQKCDGLHVSNRTLFQVYAPNEIEQAKTIAKIQTDFSGAIHHWKDHFDTWCFVHNSTEGLSPEVTKTLLVLEAGLHGKKIATWGGGELRDLVFQLDDADVARLLGPPVTTLLMHRLSMADLKPVLDAVRRSAAPKRCEGRRVRMLELGRRQQQVMGVLKTHGALDQFTQLQTELMRLDGEVEALRRRHEATERMATLKTELEIEKKTLHLRLQQDYQEQGQTIRTAIATFEEVSRSLLESPGSLIIEKTDNGPVFEPRTPGDRGGGIRQMQIFCFDMMLMRLLADRGIGPGFLIHDSHLFDGVDLRQVASALKLGAQWAEKLGFQYLVTMNSDVIPQPADRPAGFDLERYLLPNRLVDTEAGGLFGFRFD